ncbi:MAG TPA: M23 family metallopeptidase [Pseudolysinimonas sp.]|nr:M23 family metallopeptidase [Pseudolysinimonas sp.]
MLSFASALSVARRRQLSVIPWIAVVRRIAAVGLAAALWAWPVAAPHPVVGPFIAPASSYGAGHRGIDIATPAGSLVRAPADGVVHFAGVVVDRPVLSIRHPGGVLSSYEPVVATVSEGDAVHRGEVIGTLEPGHCAQPCLHLGARVNGEYVNPLLFLGDMPRAVLLPVRR